MEKEFDAEYARKLVDTRLNNNHLKYELYNIIRKGATCGSHSIRIDFNNRMYDYVSLDKTKQSLENKGFKVEHYCKDDPFKNRMPFIIIDWHA